MTLPRIFVKNAVRALFALSALLLLSSSAQAAVTPYAEEVFRFMGLPVTNSMITSWVIGIFIIIGVRKLTGTPQLSPTRGQLFMEGVVGGVRGVIEPIVGKKMVGPSFWLLSGIMVVIVIYNWGGLLPGVGSVGWYDSEGHFTPWIRPGTADANTTLAISAVAMITWVYLIFKYAGPKVIAHDLFGNKANKDEVPGAIFMFLTAVFLIVGVIEIISICIRPLTLTMRLFGSMYGGETLLHKMLLMSGNPIIDGLITTPFYFLKYLVGFVQGMVFMLLVSVYIGLICNHDSDDH